LTVGWVVTGAGGNWTGFDSDAPCTANLSTMDPAPSFKVHPKSSQFSSFFAISVGCKRKNLPELPYEYCFTYESIIDFDADVSVNDQIKLLVHINNLNI
jgi:hypothetical protein